MNKQRGIAVGWLMGALAMVLVVGAGYTMGRLDGKKLNESKWQAREAQLNAQAAIALEEANGKVRATERGAAIKVVEVSAAYQQQLKEKVDAHAKALERVRAGGAAGRLFVTATCPPPAGNPPDSPAAPAGRRDGETRVELSGTAAEFLIGEASRADQIVEQLSACQSVILTYQKMGSGK